MTGMKPILQTAWRMAGASEPKIDLSSVESRRSPVSQRRMSPGRRLLYFLVTPLLRGLMAMVWSSYRVVKVIGSDVEQKIIDGHTVCIPCYWHQQHLLCANVIRRWIRHGFDASIVISASVDGEVPARIASAWGAEVIRGSANQTGALVLRDVQDAMKRGKSIITTPDGPSGPAFEFKAGEILMARIAEAPLVPIACVANRSWHLKGWDKMVIPVPFARIVIAVGEPYRVARDTPLAELETHRVRMQDALMALATECREALGSNAAGGR